MAAKFEIQSAQAGGYSWVLVSQGRTLATSPTYTTKAAAQNGMASFRAAAADAPLVDLTLPAPKTPAGKAARVTGRVLSRAVIEGGRAAETIEKVATKASKRTAKMATNAVETVVDAATGPKRKAPAKKRR